MAQVGPSASADVIQNCRDIGNGLLCIKIDRYQTQFPPEGNITVWYDKRSGGGVEVRLGHLAPYGGIYWDNGSFWIYSGQIRGFTWYGRGAGAGCYSSKLDVYLQPGHQLITGGTVCL